MGAETFVSAIVPIAYVALVLSESKMGGRRFPRVRLWKWTGALFFAVLLTISLLTPFFIPLEWLEARRVLDLSGWGFAGVVPALLTTSFLTYWLHRAEHRLDWMWRGMHQLHHSVLRVDVSGAFFTHPAEMVAKITIGVVVSVFLYGLAPVIAATVSTLAIHLTKHLAASLANDRITVNCIAPGFFETKMTAHISAETAGRWVPLGRTGNADDAAGATIFLTSRAGAWITGATVPLDGGIVASA